MKLNLFAKELTDIIYNPKLDNNTIIEKWTNLKNEISKTHTHSRDISKIIEILEKIDKPKTDIKILDFGCGGCISIFYLAAMGYTNIWGVDLEVKPELNIFLKKILPSDENLENRISYYKKFPLFFQDNEFDLIFSQQVFEHIKFDKSDPTIDEISRLLKINAVTYNQIPHKLIPFDYHTKTWFLHWFPKSITIILLKLINKNSSFVKEHLWFKFPWYYNNSFNKKIGFTKNLSYERISEFVDTTANKNSGDTLKEFSGFNRFLRIFIAKLSKNRIIGRPVRFCFANFIMLELISKKNV